MIAPVAAAVVTQRVVVRAIVMIAGQKRKKEMMFFEKVLWFHRVGKARKHFLVVNNGTDKRILQKECLRALVRCNAPLNLALSICIMKTLI